MEIKEDKKGQLQKTHGRAVIPKGTHGRAPNRVCLTRRTTARACWHGRALSRTAPF